MTNQDKWSKQFNSFIASCLEKDPQVRPSAAKLLEHPFIKNASNSGKTDLSKFVVEVIKEKEEKKNLKKKKEAPKPAFSIVNSLKNPIEDSFDENRKSKSESTICFVDTSCGLQKELSPWDGAPIYKKPIKTKITSKIDDEKVCFIFKFIVLL